jgi:hypothetical protein
VVQGQQIPFQVYYPDQDTSIEQKSQHVLSQKIKKQGYGPIMGIQRFQSNATGQPDVYVNNNISILKDATHVSLRRTSASASVFNRQISEHKGRYTHN